MPRPRTVAPAIGIASLATRTVGLRGTGPRLVTIGAQRTTAFCVSRSEDEKPVERRVPFGFVPGHTTQQITLEAQ